MASVVAESSPPLRRTTARRPLTSLRRAGPGAQQLERLVGVRAHVRLAVEHPDDATVGVDHERRALVRQEPDAALHAEEARDRLVGVRQQRIVELVLFGELLLLVDGVGTDADALRPDRLELALEVTEVTALAGAAGRHRRRIEEEHHRAGRQQLAELARLTLLVRQLEVVDDIPHVHRRDATPAGTTMPSRLV